MLYKLIMSAANISNQGDSNIVTLFYNSVYRTNNDSNIFTVDIKDEQSARYHLISLLIDDYNERDPKKLFDYTTVDLCKYFLDASEKSKGDDPICFMIFFNGKNIYGNCDSLNICLKSQSLISYTKKDLEDLYEDLKYQNESNFQDESMI